MTAGTEEAGGWEMEEGEVMMEGGGGGGGITEEEMI